VVRDLVKAGWHVEAERKDVPPLIGNAHRFHLGSGLVRAARRGEYDGVEVLLPELLKPRSRRPACSVRGWVLRHSAGRFLEKYGLLARLGVRKAITCASPASQAGLLDVLLAARPGNPVDEIFTRAREELRRF